MKSLILGCLFGAFVSTPTFVGAQSSDEWQSMEQLRSCYTAAKTGDQKAACIFSASEACQEQSDGGYSTVGMMRCNQSETAAWDILLNEEYAATMRGFQMMDDDDKIYTPDVAKERTRVYNLRQAQRAWITFRDAECATDYALWGMGSMRMIAGSACLLNMTAKRTIALYEKRDRMH